MSIPLVDLKAQYRTIKADVDAAIERVLSHTGFILGEEVARFEARFADYVGAKHAVGVASGTGALKLALLAAGVRQGDEVITTAHTFFATAEAISQIGARPVFVDIDERTYNLDPNRVESVLKSRSGRVKAIVPVHLYGLPADMPAFSDIGKRHGVRVIEDAAQAHGAEVGGRRCGGLGDLACFSFFPGKNLGAYGDAGGVTGSDDDLIRSVRKLRDHGRTSKYSHDEIGYGERLDALQAAVLDVKLGSLEKWTEARIATARAYDQLFSELDFVRPFVPQGYRHVFHLYVLRSPARDQILDSLKAHGVGAGIHYPIPLHRQPAYLAQGYGEISLPHTERVAKEVFSLPIFPEITPQQIQQVAQAVRGSVGL